MAEPRVGWYDHATVVEALTGVEVALVLVDGPPSASEDTRWPALYALEPVLTEHAQMLIDDGRRAGEPAWCASGLMTTRTW